MKLLFHIEVGNVVSLKERLIANKGYCYLHLQSFNIHTHTEIQRSTKLRFVFLTIMA